MEDRDKTITISHEEAMLLVHPLTNIADQMFIKYPELLPREDFFSGYAGMKKQLELLSPGESLLLDISGAFCLAYLIQIVYSIIRRKMKV